MAGPRLPTTPAKRRVRYSVITLAAVVIGLFVALPAHEEGMACGGPPELASEHRGAIPASYFGMHIHRAAAGPTWPSIEFFGWRLWDAYVTWPHLQPTREHWDWTRLDGLVNLAQEKRIEVLLPLGQSPPWVSARPEEPSLYRPGYAAEPRDLGAWRKYVETVATRYKGRIHLYELWNEPNLAGFYTGEVASMVTLCREARAVLKRVDPSILFVSPSATKLEGVEWLDSFLTAGGADCFDVVGYHLYTMPGPPERMVPIMTRLHEVMAKHGISDRPLWNTEAGWKVALTASLAREATDSTMLDEEKAAGYLARALLLAWAGGASRFYWYSWDNKVMGMQRTDGSLGRSVKAYAEVRSWMLGARMDSCGEADSGVWVCSLTRGEQHAWIIWSAGERKPFTLPEEWKVSLRKTLAGDSVKLASREINAEIVPALYE